MENRMKGLAMKAGLLPVVLPLFLAVNAHAASFDCGKTTTKIEKMICTVQELSTLDEKMANTYEKALPKAPDSAVVKQQQKEWLKERDSCLERACLNDQYQLRLGELQRIIDLVPLAATEESHYFEKESEKLKVIQDVVRRQSFVWYNPYDKEPEFCTEFKNDFIKGLHLEVVEPDFRSDDVHDPRFAKLNRCENPQIHPDESFEGEFWGIKHLGGPPFRYYSFELDGNPKNGKEDILYSETAETDSGTGYTWIDSQKCIIRVGAGQSTRLKDSPRYLYRLTILAKYKGELIMVGISPTPWAPNPTSYYFDMWRFAKKEHLLECAFHFDIKQNKKIKTQSNDTHGGKDQ